MAINDVERLFPRGRHTEWHSWSHPDPLSVSPRANQGLLLDVNSEQPPQLTVILPTLNEEAGIAVCIEKIKRAIAELGITAEIIVADNSTDETPKIARELGAIVVEPDRPGYGYAYRYAFRRARGELIVMGDADTTYDFEAIPRLLKPVFDGEADIVLGSRLRGEIKPGAMPTLHQYVGNPLLTKFLNVFYDTDVSDAHSGFRVCTRAALEALDLESVGMEFASEMLMDAVARDLTIEEVPITYHERVGEATLDSFTDGWRHVKFILLNAPGFLFSLPGALASVLGLIVMTVAFFDITVGSIGFGPHSMIAGSLLTIVGYQIASMGVFATLAGDPIRVPTDPITEWLLDHASLERGATLGLLMFFAGTSYALYLIFQWINSGFSQVPLVVGDMVAMTAIVLGIQTIFGSFFMSAVAEQQEQE